MKIILVDDGSPDNCPQICDSWAEKYNNIKVFHKSNGGLSDARNFGLINASGEYVWCVDSDDKLLPNAVKTVLEVMRFLASCSDKKMECGLNKVLKLKL